MKAGDLLQYKGAEYFPSLNNEKDKSWWLVMRVNKSKKTWHRTIILFNGEYFITVPWDEKDMFEVISESR